MADQRWRTDYGVTRQMGDPLVATWQHRVIPVPRVVEPGTGPGFRLDPQTTIHTDLPELGEELADSLRPATGLPLPVHSDSPQPRQPALVLRLTGAPERVGNEGYLLDSGAGGVSIHAHTPTGIGNGIQTLLQLLPPEVASASRQPGPWPVPAVRILDWPRYPYRGAMLDVARHFFPVEAVCGFIDRIARYKLNHLHLHLTDDQGWRLAIEGWPELTRRGATSAVGGDPGGHFTQPDFRRIVEYAARRRITIVPEIDMPGHTHAALLAYPDLNPAQDATMPYTGMKVGFSTLDPESELSYRFVSEVLAEVAALTPGPYLHIGGDEAHATPAEAYARFLRRVQPMVAELGRTAIGWQEIAAVPASGPRILQFWRPDPPTPQLLAAVRDQDQLVLSPARHAYLDMRYDPSTPIGLDWAGTIEVRDAYEWEPEAVVAGAPPSAVRGVEAPLWSETTSTVADLDYLAFPRLPAIAEVGWSAPEDRDWEQFRHRLAAHGARWEAAGVGYYRSPQIPW